MPGVRAFVLYIDDVVLRCEARQEARHGLDVAEGVLRDALDLRPKAGAFVQRARAGLSFLGFRIYPGVLRLSRRRQRRYREALAS